MLNLLNSLDRWKRQKEIASLLNNFKKEVFLNTTRIEKLVKEYKIFHVQVLHCQTVLIPTVHEDDNTTQEKKDINDVLTYLSHLSRCQKCQLAILKSKNKEYLFWIKEWSEIECINCSESLAELPELSVSRKSLEDMYSLRRFHLKRFIKDIEKELCKLNRKESSMNLSVEKQDSASKPEVAQLNLDTVVQPNLDTIESTKDISEATFLSQSIIISDFNFPAARGIYLVRLMDNGCWRNLYIGKSVNLKQRWSQHHRRKDISFLMAHGSIIEIRAIIETDFLQFKESLELLEKKLIYSLKPEWNRESVQKVLPIINLAKTISASKNTGNMLTS